MTERIRFFCTERKAEGRKERKKALLYSEILIWTTRVNYGNIYRLGLGILNRDDEQAGGTRCSERKSGIVIRRNTKRIPPMKVIRRFLQTRRKRKKDSPRRVDPGLMRPDMTDMTKNIRNRDHPGPWMTMMNMKKNRRRNRNRGAFSGRKPGNRTLLSACC